MELLTIVTHPEHIANIKTRCKNRDRGVNYSLYAFIFQHMNLQSRPHQSSSDLWIIWSIANKNGSIFSSLAKVKEQRNNNSSSDSIRGSWSRWHKNVGQVSSTQTNGPAEGESQEVSERLWQGSGVSLLLLLLQRSSWWKKKITHGSKIMWGCSICQIHGPNF